MDGQMHDSTTTLHNLAANERYAEDLPQRLEKHQEDLEPLFRLGFHGLDAKVKSSGALSYEEAFSLATFVCLTSNTALRSALQPELQGIDETETLRLQAVSLLQGMSTREGLIGFEPQEIAGMVAATLELDTVARIGTPHDEPTYIVGGMGGDKGLPRNGEQSKLFSTSTLASIALAGFGVVHKHHSYPNTSKVAGQSAVEAMGARSDMEDVKTMELALGAARLLMTSCHSIRTLHTISHVLKGETVNHAIGPLAVPHARENEVNALIGVNHNVHPKTITESLKILQEKGVQMYGNCVAFCGVKLPQGDIPEAILQPNEYYADPELKELVILDEVAPPPYSTMVSFLVDGNPSDTYVIEATDFMSEEDAKLLELGDLLIPNTPEDIMSANESVLLSRDKAKSGYVAMTVALANFAREYAHLPDALSPATHRVNSEYLKLCYKAAVEDMDGGSMDKTMRLYAEATQKDMLPNIDVVVLDIDNTLALPKDPSFYTQYAEAVDVAVSRYLGISPEAAKHVANFYRQHYGGGEQALFSGTIGSYFPEYGSPEPDYKLLYEAMTTIDPENHFVDSALTVGLVKLLRQKGKKIVGLTDAPEELSRQVLSECGLDPDVDFDLYISYQSESGPPKMVQGEAIFRDIAERFEVEPSRVLSVGDNLETDIVPAQKAGLKTCLISESDVQDYQELQATNFADVFRTYRRSI